MYSKRLTFIKFDQCSDFARDQNVAMLFSLKLEAILDSEHSKKLKISAFTLYRVQMSRLSFLTTKNDLKVGSQSIYVSHIHFRYIETRGKKQI